MAIHFNNPTATFIHIPKTAGSSFEQWAYDNIAYDRQQKHCTLLDAKNIWNDLGTTFTFVRNPFDRIVSLFHFIGQRAVERIQVRKQGIRTKKTTNQEDDLLIANYYKLGFENWLIDHSQNISNPFDLGIWMYKRKTPMVHWTNNQIDIVIKVEELKEKLYIIEELFNRSIILPHTNKSNRGHYRTYYTANTKAIIEDIFKKDLDTFGYEF
tara:strand:- start:491 stop:1123 length:633 start_codon:yes stop_codon:yes gene_type:complete